MERSTKSFSVLMTVVLLLFSLGNVHATCQADSAKWTSIGLTDVNESIQDIAIHPTDADTIYAITNSEIYKTENCGDSWNPLSVTDSAFTQIHLNTESPDTLIALGYHLHKSLDGGQSWNRIDQGIPYSENQRICDIAVHGEGMEMLYAGVCGDDEGALYSSSDVGSTWSRIEDTSEVRLNYPVTQLDLMDGISNNLFVGTDNENLFYTADTGSSLYSIESDTSITNIKKIEATSYGTYVLSGNLNLQTISVRSVSDGEYTDTAFTVSIPENVNTIHDLNFGAYYNCGQYMHMATDNGIYRQAIVIATHPCFEGSTEWTKTSNGLPHENIHTHAFGSSREGDTPYSVIGLREQDGQSGVYIRANTEDAASNIENPSLPEQLVLWQNYPNPFNPATNIKFNLPQPADVQLTIYNTIGQKVSTLVNRQMTAGSHSITFNASGLPSGVYIYQLKTDDFSESRKMLLLK